MLNKKETLRLFQDYEKLLYLCMGFTKLPPSPLQSD